MNTDGNVVIENQFGSTDHNHLGQLLTYAAGTDSEFVIWLSESFRDEHRSVLEWMNNSNSGVMFFGVRPRVIKLQDADKIGFEFDVVVEPNDWERELRDNLSSRDKAYKEFFTELTSRYAEQNLNWTHLKAQPQSWLSFGAGISGVSFSWSFHRGPDLSTELYIDTGDGTRNEEIYSALKSEQKAIDENLGEVVWQRLPEKRACRIKVARDIDDDIEGLSAMEKQELIKWAVGSMDEIRQEFEPRLTTVWTSLHI